ncbi:MAG: phage terminase large subunit family protein [Rhodospirillales bacterium]
MSAATSPSSPIFASSSAEATGNYEGESDIIAAWRRGLQLEPAHTVSAWADRHRILSPRGANEPGPWRTARTPYLREIMDALSPAHPAQRVVFMKGAQVGATECGNNWIGYNIHHAPGPMLVVQPTVDLAKRFSQQRVETLIDDTPAVRSRVAPARSRNSNNTRLSKEFPGGLLVMTGTNSAVGLRSMPVRYLFLDEVDAYPPSADEEGDPVALAEARTRTFSWRRKMFVVSTPKLKGSSRIEPEYLTSDQRRYFVPCPDCQGEQWLKFDQLRWDKGKPETVAYVCEHCGALISERHKTAMLEAGRWQATTPAVNPTTVGFHLSALYSPVGWYSWEQLAREYEAADGDDEKTRAFYNLVLGESWDEKGEAPDYELLLARREDYPLLRMPADALVLTCGVDVQARYLQYEVVAWGPGLTSWSIDFGVLEGDTADDRVWLQLQTLLGRSYPDAGRVARPIEMTAIDSGYNTQWVYHFCRRRPGVIAVKGRPGPLAPILGTPQPQEVNFRGKRIARGVMLWPIGDWQLKSELYANLRKSPDEDGSCPPGYCHFSRGHDQGFFEQLTAEKFVTRVERGRARQDWVLPFGKKNEALDCRKYARAAAEHLGLARLSGDEWRRLAAQRGMTPPPLRQGELPLAAAPAAPVTPPTAELPAPVPPAPLRPAPAAGDDWFGGRTESWL